MQGLYLDLDHFLPLARHLPPVEDVRDQGVQARVEARAGQEGLPTRDWAKQVGAQKQSVKDAHDLQHVLTYHAHVHLEEDG